MAFLYAPKVAHFETINTPREFMRKGKGYNNDTAKRIHSGNANYCANSAAIVPASQPQSAGEIQVFPKPNIRLQHSTKTLDLEPFVHPTQISPPAIAPETLWNAFTDPADVVSADSVTQRICDDECKTKEARKDWWDTCRMEVYPKWMALKNMKHE